MSKKKKSTSKPSKGVSVKAYLRKPGFTPVPSESSIKSTRKRIKKWLTSLQQDSPANLSPELESSVEKKMKEICGPTRLTPLLSYNQDMSYWKTCQGFLTPGIVRKKDATRKCHHILDEFSETWPNSGMMLSGSIYQLNKLALGIRVVTESGFTYPTPTTMDHLPPRSQEAMKRIYDGHRKGRKAPSNLREFFHRKLYPTPLASSYKGCGPKGSKSQRHMLKKGYLCAMVVEENENLLFSNSGSELLNPDWIEWQMGWPIGWTSDDDIEFKWPDWSYDPADKGEVERMKEDVPNRKHRIIMTGNGQVPQCYHEGWRVFLGRKNAAKYFDEE